MSEFALLGRLVAGAAFLAAGAVKIAEPGRSAFRVALREFGLGRRSVALAAPLLPWVEMSLGALLLVGLFVRPAAVAMVALLAAFSAVVARALGRNQKVDCGCFGAFSGRPAGPGALVRNLLLSLAAGLAATEGGLSAPWGPAERAVPVALVAVGILIGSAVASHLGRLRRAS